LNPRTASFLSAKTRRQVLLWNCPIIARAEALQHSTPPARSVSAIAPSSPSLYIRPPAPAPQGRRTYAETVFQCWKAAI